MQEVELKRKTKETDIAIKLSPDCGESTIQTNIGFFDHMLTALAVHGGFKLDISVTGDLHVDCHHTIEDTGIVLGKAFKQALMDTPIARYGNASIPMDEALGTCVLDISGRPFLVFSCDFRAEKIGDMDTQMVEEFFRAFAFNAGITMHIACPYGSNDHHKAEAIFKAVAHALRMAVKPKDSLLSTKGVLDI